jgi:DNA-binding CsgD family transcriptional regulator
MNAHPTPHHAHARWIETLGAPDGPPLVAVAAQRSPQGAPHEDPETRDVLLSLLRRLDRLQPLVEQLIEAVEDAPTRPKAAIRGHIPLTVRQLEILSLVAAGRTTDEIARCLFLSPATIRNHVARTLKALDAHSRLEAVAKARDLGLL